MTQIYKVIQQGEAYQIDSQKTEGGKLSKCNIMLQELGGKFENQYVAVMLGNTASLRFYEGDIVAAKLRFQTHEYGEQVFQDITVQEIVKLS